MERKSFIVYLDLLDSLDELNDAQAGKLFKTIKAYHMSKAEGASQECVTNFEGLLKDFVNRLAFAPFRAAFERDAEKYRDKCSQMRENGKKGGRPRNKTECLNENQTKPKGFSENQKVLKKADNDNDNDILESRENAHEHLLGVFFERQITTDSFLKRWETTEEELRRICQDVIEDWTAIKDPHLESEDDDAKRHFLNAVRKKYEILKTKTNENKPSYQPKSSGIRSKRSEEPGYGLVD